MKYFRKLETIKRGNKELALIERVSDGKVAIFKESWLAFSGIKDENDEELLIASSRTKSIRIDSAEWQTKGIEI